MQGVLDICGLAGRSRIILFLARVKEGDIVMAFFYDHDGMDEFDDNEIRERDTKMHWRVEKARKPFSKLHYSKHEYEYQNVSSTKR